MSKSAGKILLIEDNPADVALLQEQLEVSAETPEWIICSNLADGLKLASREPVAAVFLDLSLPDSYGLETVRRAVAMLGDLPVVVLTGIEDEQLGLESLRAGAQDYLIKGKASADSIARAVRYAIERQRILRDLHEARNSLEEKVRERTEELANTVDSLQNEVLQRLQAEQELRAANEQLRERASLLRTLAAELTLAEQRERRRMARLLHDHLQQLLVGAKFRVSILGRVGDDVVKRAAAEIEELLKESINASRSLTAELSPPILHEGGLIAGLEWLARWMADKHGLIVDLAAGENAPVIAEDVKILLFESVRELLFNAVKHAHVHSVRVNVRQLTGDILQIMVSDDGPGFDPSKVGLAGQPGSGFGLFSIRERLDLIGGQLTIDSAPGRGSRFILRAPLERGAVPANPVSDSHAVMVQPPRANSTKARVLLADDHAVMRDGLARLLGREPDVEIIGQASDGEMAVDLAKDLMPDVVLMDLSMPKLNGIDATRIIHERMPHVKVIGLSMFDEAERAQAIYAAGAVAYLTKSGPSHDIVDAIRACMKVQGRDGSGA